MIQSKSSFQLKLCHSLNTVSSKTFAVRKIITRGGGPGVTLGSSMTIPLHLPLFRMLSTSVPSISQPLLRSFQVFFQIPKCTIICPFSVARRTTPPRKGKRTLNQFQAKSDLVLHNLTFISSGLTERALYCVENTFLQQII